MNIVSSDVYKVTKNRFENGISLPIIINWFGHKLLVEKARRQEA
jgi:hypothetical protein